MLYLFYDYMYSLRNVGEIRFVFDVPTSKNKIEDVAENIKGYDFQSTVDSLELLHDSLQKNKIPQGDWQLLYDERNKQNVMSFVRNTEYDVKFYAFVWDNPQKKNMEVGITYMEPINTWLEQAKVNNKKQTSESKENTRKSKSKRKNSTIDIKHNHNPDKKEKIETKEQKQKQETEKKDRIDVDIDKETLIIYLMARVSNLLHATKWDDDYRVIIEAYPELDDILSNIYNMNSLMKYKSKLPHKLTSQDLERIKQVEYAENKEDIIQNSEFEGIERIID